MSTANRKPPFDTEIRLSDEWAILGKMWIILLLLFLMALILGFAGLITFLFIEVAVPYLKEAEQQHGMPLKAFLKFLRYFGVLFPWLAIAFLMNLMF